jgi:hypothetical protein
MNKIVIYHLNRVTGEKEYATKPCENNKPVEFTSDLDKAYNFSNIPNANKQLFVFNYIHRQSHLIRMIDNSPAI